MTVDPPLLFTPSAHAVEVGSVVGLVEDSDRSSAAGGHMNRALGP